MRLLIEEFIPVEEISEEAKKEKLGTAKPPTFELHYWWARKPLITARAALLGALLSKENIPQKFQNSDLKTSLINILALPKDISKGPRAHKESIPEEFLRDAIIKTWGEMPTILDPFAGGGSIPFEALRHGCNVVAVDYNPVAYLILKATLEYPKKYGMQLYYDVEKYLNQIFDELKKELGGLYPKHNGKDVAAYLFAWLAKCPQCGFETPLVGSWQLAKTKRGKKLYLNYEIIHNELEFEVREGFASGGNVSRGKGVCLKCGGEIPNKNVVEEIKKYEKEKELAVVLLSGNGKGKGYDVPSENDLAAFNEAKNRLKKDWFNFYKKGLIPDNELPDDNRGSIWAKAYLPKWYQLFNPRQLLLIINYAEKAKEIVNTIAEDDREYAKAVGVYLDSVLSKHIDYNCRAASWHSSYEVISSMFRQRGISMMWNHTEVNPFVKSSGTLISNINGVLNSLKYSIEKLSSTQGYIQILNEPTASWKTNDKFKIIVTDPPYYDDIPYGEVSEVFYVWHKRILGHLFEKESKFFSSDKVETKEELDVGGNRDNEFFNQQFLRNMQNLHKILDDDGILVLFFAHKNPEAWYFVLESLRQSGFRITSTFPIHTESTESSATRGKKSVYHSLIISARKRTEEKVGFLEEMMPEIETKIHERAEMLENYGLKGSDLLVAAMGVALEVLTGYSETKSYSGNITARSAIKIAQTIMAKHETRKMIGEEADPVTTFYVYSRIHDMDSMDYSTANQFIKSLGLDEESLEKDKLINIEKKKSKRSVKLQDYYRGDSNLEVAGYDAIKGNSLIDYVHKALRAYDIEGMRRFDKVASESPFSRKAFQGVLQALAKIRQDPDRQNDREAKKAEEILKHIKSIGLESWGVE